MSTVMRCLSIRQPWAWLVVNGHKPIENRDWPTGHRGDLLIHAGRAFDHAGLSNVLQRFPHLRAAMPTQYELGGVVGRAQLVQCVEYSVNPWFTGPYGFVLHDARPMPLVPMRGQLGIYSVPMSDALHKALHGQTPEQAEAAGQMRLLG
jgi:hypothetical protein